MKIDNHNRKLAPASISKTTIISNRIVVSGEAMCGPIYTMVDILKKTHIIVPRDIDIQKRIALSHHQHPPTSTNTPPTHPH